MLSDRPQTLRCGDAVTPGSRAAATGGPGPGPLEEGRLTDAPGHLGSSSRSHPGQARGSALLTDPRVSPVLQAVSALAGGRPGAVAGKQVARGHCLSRHPAWPLPWARPHGSAPQGLRSAAGIASSRAALGSKGLLPPASPACSSPAGDRAMLERSRSTCLGSIRELEPALIALGLGDLGVASLRQVAISKGGVGRPPEPPPGTLHFSLPQLNEKPLLPP